MKPVVIFDTSIFAIPNAAQKRPDIEQILLLINDWAERIETQNCVEFAVLSEAIQVLSEANCFPATHNIQSLLDLYDLSHVFTAQEINSRIFSILSRSSYVFEAVGFEIVSHRDAHTSDIDLTQSPHKILDDALFRVLGSASISRKADIINIVQGFPCSSNPAEVEMAAESYIDADNNSITFDPPRAIDSKLSLVLGPLEFLRTLNPIKLWEFSEHATEFAFAISLEAAAALGILLERLPLNHPHASLVGTEFVASLQRNQAFGSHPNAGTVLKKCAEAVARTKGEFIRDFDSSREGDEARAYRMHVTKSHEALRLMFWTRQDGRVELANVGPKNELKIFNGDYKVEHEAVF